MSVDEQLAWEARQRPRAALAALVGGIAPIAAIAISIALSDAPRQASLLTSVQRAAEPGAVGQLDSLRIPYFEWYDDNAIVLLIAGVSSALGFLALAFVVSFIARATRARSDSLPRWALPLPLVGAFSIAAAVLIATIDRIVGVGEFLDGDRTVALAEPLNEVSAAPPFATALGLIGTLTLPLALVLVALNAMRVGLLTRFMGVLGIVMGAFLLLQIGPTPVIQAFWLAALALLLLGRWPSGDPPAWSSGQAEPWPTARDQRGGAEAVPAPAPAPKLQHPSSRKRKRKRRA